MKIAFDVGGVLSKFPDVFRDLFNALKSSSLVQVHVISDMHPRQKIADMLAANRFHLHPKFIHSADYAKHGELCKAILCEELGIDMLIDDHLGYVATGKHIRLLVMPDPHEPYYHDEWLGSEGNFGRRRNQHSGELVNSGKPIRKENYNMELNWKKILEHVSPERREYVRELIEQEYADVVTTNWPVIETGKTLRFREDPMTVWLKSKVDLNDMCVAYQKGETGTWDRERMKDFYRGMGYSLYGFREVFYS